MRACREDTKTKRKRWSGQHESMFKKAIIERYNASIKESRSAWCHLLDQCAESEVRVVHLVPDSFQSTELSYLFGVGEMPRMDPRNGLTLHHRVAEAWDRGDIAIVPVPSETPNEVSQWKFVVVNENIRKEVVYRWPTTWNDIDGRILQFWGENRPGKRYLYFRYLFTYFHQKRLGNLKWTYSIESRGNIWTTLGPYLRRTMLEILAGKASDLVLPEVFWKMVSETTFEESESSPAMSPDQEELLAKSLAMRCKDYMNSREWIYRDEYDYHSEDDYDSDSSEDVW